MATLRHLPGLFFKLFLASVLLYAVSCAATVAGMMALSIQWFSGEGWWRALTPWLLIALVSVIGIVAGGILGAIASLKDVVDSAGEALKTIVEKLPTFSSGEPSPAASVEDTKVQYGAMLDRALDASLGRLPLPAFIGKSIRTTLHEAVVGDFLAHLEQRGITAVAPQEFRNWLLSKGLAPGLLPAHNQLALWQAVVITVLVVTVLILVVIGYLAR